MNARRYRVAFTPVGWQVVDSVVASDPIGEYGTGTSEYQRAALHAFALNAGSCNPFGIERDPTDGSESLDEWRRR